MASKPLSKGESDNLTETSDRAIYQAVMDAIDTRENININGSLRDDIVLEDGVPPDPRATHRDLLKAVSTVCRYIV